MDQATFAAEYESARNELVSEFSKHRESLWKAVFFRLDHRLSGRVDPDDVLQEAWLDANRRLNQFVREKNSWSMLVWIRVILKQTLVNVHRRHFFSKKRDASKEVAKNQHHEKDNAPTLAETCFARTATPSRVVMRKELATEIESALDQMRPNDRAILLMRHFDELANKEIAQRLGISEKAASTRYVRAIERLRGVMEEKELPARKQRTGSPVS